MDIIIAILITGNCRLRAVREIVQDHQSGIKIQFSWPLCTIIFLNVHERLCNRGHDSICINDFQSDNYEFFQRYWQSVWYQVMLWLEAVNSGDVWSSFL